MRSRSEGAGGRSHGLVLKRGRINGCRVVKIAAPITPYVENIEVTVIEEDDIDDNDVGVGSVPLVTEAEGAPGLTILHAGIDGRILGSLEIGVDDGRYAFCCVITRWHPSAQN